MMGRRIRIAAVLLAAIIAFIGLMNSAIICHGVLMVLGIGPWAWAVDHWLVWARNVTVTNHAR
jgi:uncharacterized membrane protein YphA (DoxX/SURF4 family)